MNGLSRKRTGVSFLKKIDNRILHHLQAGTAKELSNNCNYSPILRESRTDSKRILSAFSYLPRSFWMADRFSSFRLANGRGF